MVTLDVIINSWDNPRGLDRLLGSKYLLNFVNKVFIREGQYVERPEEAENRREDTYNIINKWGYRPGERFDGKISYTDNHGTQTQIEKRNALWDEIEKDNPDFALVLDTDEYVVIDPPVLRQSLYDLMDYPYRCLPVKNQYMKTNFRIPRLFKGPYNFRHRLNVGGGISHGGLWDRTNPSTDKKDTVTQEMHRYDEIFPPKRGTPEHTNGVEGLQVFHDKSVYSNERLLNNEDYYSKVLDR